MLTLADGLCKENFFLYSEVFQPEKNWKSAYQNFFKKFDIQKKYSVNLAILFLTKSIVLPLVFTETGFKQNIFWKSDFLHFLSTVIVIENILQFTFRFTNHLKKCLLLFTLSTETDSLVLAPPVSTICSSLRTKWFSFNRLIDWPDKIRWEEIGQKSLDQSAIDILKEFLLIFKEIYEIFVHSSPVRNNIKTASRHFATKAFFQLKMHDLAKYVFC